MVIKALCIKNFRGIADLEWTSNKNFCCIIGPGDSGKSTVLDSIEATLSSKWFTFSESDFINCDTSNSIVIEVTIGELSKQLKSDERFGLYVRGWTAGNLLRDEPEDDDEPVLTVRLTVDSTLEPVWDLVCDRADNPRNLSNRDRALFGLVRLAGDDARHLAWGHGSVLSRLTGNKDKASAVLAQAYKAARDSAGLDQISSLTTAAKGAEAQARSLGAYVDGSYGPGLELGRAGISSGSIALHDNGVPLRLAGLGTRRLATLAIQRSAITEGAIVLIDEIEHGLEPHRIIGAISQLKNSQTESLENNLPVGQIIITTHSDVALAESGADALFVCHVNKTNHKVELLSPESPEPIRDLIRFNPKALLSRRIVVAEGHTEIGLIMGFRSFLASKHEQVSIEQLGVALADGNGAQAPARASAFAKLGFGVALFRDSDTGLSRATLAELTRLGVEVIEYDGGQNTENAIFSVASDAHIQALLDFMRLERGEDSLNDSLHPRIIDLDATTVKQDFAEWEAVTGLTGEQLRNVIAEASLAKNQCWFKDSRVAREVAPIVWSIAIDNTETPLASALLALEVWLYA